MRVGENRIQTGGRRTEGRKDVCCSSADEVFTLHATTAHPPHWEKEREGGGGREETLPLDLDPQHLALDSVVLRAEEAAAQGFGACIEGGVPCLQRVLRFRIRIGMGLGVRVG